jgi:hypothetical protein
VDRGAQLDAVEDVLNLRHRQDFLERPVEVDADVLLHHPQHRADRGHPLQPLQQGAPVVVGVLLDHPVQVGVDVGQRRDHHRGQTRQEGAVEPTEGVAEVADR